MTFKAAGVILTGLPTVGLINDNYTAIRWKQLVQKMGPWTGPYVQHRVHFSYTPWGWLYSVTAIGVNPSPEPPWDPDSYTTDAPSLQDDTFAWGMSALMGVDDPTGKVYYFAGVDLLCDPELFPRQANRYVGSDFHDYQGVATGAGPTGGLTSLADTGHVFSGAASDVGFSICTRYNTANQEFRKITVAPDNGSTVQWDPALPLEHGAVTAGTPYRIIAQRTEVRTRSDLTAPIQIECMIQRMGTVTNPGGNLWRSCFDGSWTVPIPGTYSMWKLSQAYAGVWRDVCVWYFPTPDIEQGAGNPFGMGSEIHYDEPANPLSNILTDLRWWDVFVLDGPSNKWYGVNRWQITGSSFQQGSDNNLGYNPTVADGKITHRVGYANEERTIGRYQLSSLTYERLAVATPLTSNGNLRVSGTHGTAVYIGPMWTKPSATYPFIQQDTDHGFYIMHPEVGDGAVLVFTAPYSGAWQFVGDFAKANSASSWPNGSRVRIVAGPESTELFNQPIDVTLAFGLAANPFQAVGGGPSPTNKHFSVTTNLIIGQRVLFSVEPDGASAGGLATAFQLTNLNFLESFATGSTGRAVSGGFLSSLLAAGGDGLLPLLTVTWNDGVFQGTTRVAANSDVPVSSRGNIFIAGDFITGLPDEDDSDMPLLKILVQDPDLVLRKQIRVLDTRYPATGLVELVRISDPNVVEQTWKGTIRSYQMTKTTIALSNEIFRNLSREPLTPYRMAPAYGWNSLRGR